MYYVLNHIKIVNSKIVCCFLSLYNEYSDDYTNILSHDRRNRQFINATDLANHTANNYSTIKLVNYKQQFFTIFMIRVTQC